VKSSLRNGVGGAPWRRWWLSAAAAAGLTLSFASTAQAAVALDANVSQTVNTGFNSVFAFRTMAQTFTAVHTGQLTEVDLFCGTSWSPTTLKIQVWNVSQGTPVAMASTVSVTGTLPFTPDWHAFHLTNTVPVTAGQQYAIVATAGLANYFRWGYNGTITYSGGKMLVLSGSTWTGFTGLATGSAFNFRTWVDAGAPTVTPPVIGHDTPAAASDESAAPTMTGTYSNRGATVNLTADHGTVSPQSGTGGSWTWTGDVYDEDNAPSSVTITATDPATGLVATTNFPLAIKALSPVASISTGVALASSVASSGKPEGSSLTLNASARSQNPADQAAGFTYAWTVTRNGTTIFSGPGSSYTLTAMDEGTYVATLTAKDDGGMTSDSTSVTVVANEVQPSASITSIALADPTVTFIAPLATLNFNGTYSDPSPESHSFQWDFGDGSSANTLATTHSYAVAGTYTVRLTVKDDEGVAGTATATVKVLTPQQALASMVAYVQGITTLNKGQQNSLIAKLNAASDSWSRGDKKTAGNQLNAFLNELEADLKTGKISAAAYNALRADAHAVQGSIGTYNRFLEWWPLPA
jgi:PKD repeat protein